MKKLLLGLGSIAAVVAPVAAVISCGVEVTVTEGHGDNGNTGAGTTETVNPTLASTVNANIAAMGNIAATDITKTEKVTNFVFGASHPVTYDYAVSYTLAAKSGGINLTFGSESITSSVDIEAGDKLVVAVKMPSTVRRAAATAPAMPEVHVILVPKDSDVPPTDQHINDNAAMEKLAKEILVPVFPVIQDSLGGPVEVDLGVAGTNPMTWTDLLAKIKAVIKSDTDGVVLKLGSAELQVHFAAGADDAAIKTAVESAVSHATSFTGCFDMTN